MLGFLNPLYVAVAWVIMRIHAILAVPFGADSGAAWGLSIVLLVIVLRVLMLPLFIKQVHAQQRMQQHMPQLQEIRKKYKNDKQKLNEETMKYYRENGVNPLSGCLPLLAQFPVFISLFNVLRAIAQDHAQYGLTLAVVHSATKAKVFGVLLSDTFLHSTTPWSVRGVILASVLISACTTFLTMWQSQRRGMMQQGPVDPNNPMAQSQKIMVYIAPLFALSGLYWQYGLVIYWVTNNLWTLGQQYFLFRNLPLVGSATADAATAPPSGVKATAAATKTASRPASAAKPAATNRASATSKAATAGKSATAGKAGAARPAAGSAKPAAPAAPAGDQVEQVDDRDEPAGRPAAKAGGTPAKAGTARQAAAPPKPAPAKKSGPGVNGSAAAPGSSSSGGGLGRLFGKGKPEPESVAPQKSTVRQQPIRQTRSKRSGKR